MASNSSGRNPKSTACSSVASCCNVLSIDN